MQNGVPAAIAGKLFGAEALSLTDLKKITAGGFTISVDGRPITVTELNFSAASTPSDVAAVIAAKVTGTTVVYNSNSESFTITSETTGADSEVSVATDGLTVDKLGTDTATALGLTGRKRRASIRRQRRLDACG